MDRLGEMVREKRKRKKNRCLYFTSLLHHIPCMKRIKSLACVVRAAARCDIVKSSLAVDGFWLRTPQPVAIVYRHTDIPTLQLQGLSQTSGASKNGTKFSGKALSAKTKLQKFWAQQTPTTPDKWNSQTVHINSYMQLFTITTITPMHKEGKEGSLL